WDSIDHKIHGALTEAGGDRVAYYELEDIILSEGTQAGYATQFAKRLINNIVIINRKGNAELSIHIMPFTGDKNIISPGAVWSASASSLEELEVKISAAGENKQSKNLLVIDVPEFVPKASQAEIAATNPEFLPR